MTSSTDMKFRREIILGGFVLAASITVSAEILVGYGEAVATNVAVGTVVQDGRVLVSDGGSLYKTGIGTWSLRTSDIVQPNAADLTVVNGTLALEIDDSAATSAWSVPEIAMSAYMWIDASLFATRPELFTFTSSGGTTQVNRCLDVRETSTASPTFPYVQSNVFTNYVDASPQIRTLGDKTAFWFGGYGSGLFFDWMKAGSRATITYRHAFFVHRVDSTWGFIAGTGLHTAGWGSAVASTNYPAWNSNYMRAIQSGRVYLDGTLFDGFVNPMPTGTHLLDVDLGADSINGDAFFRDRDLFATSVGYRAGGDWLCEVLLFTNRLTEVERVQVSDYLISKWKGASIGTRHFATSSSSTVALSATEANRSELAFAGAGVVVKTGAATPVLGGSGEVFDGLLSVQNGTVDTRGAFAVSVAAGDRLTAAASTAGTLVSVTHDAGSGNLVKCGSGEAFVRQVPEGVKTLDVTEGTLTFLPAATNTAPTSCDGALDVAIPNQSFEEWDSADVTGGVFDKSLSSTTAYHGWYGTANVSVFDYDRWTPATENGTEASRQAFGLTRPSDGACALFIHHAYRPGHPYSASGGAAWTYVDIPASGTYEFTCRTSGRGATSDNQSYGGTPADILLIDESTTPHTTNRLGRVRYIASWRQYAVRGKVAGSGRHQLRINGMSPGDRSLVLDELSLRRVPEPNPMAWPIPGGTFEDASFEIDDITGLAYGSWNAWNFHCRAFCTTNTVSGWEFVQPSGWAEGSAPAVGVSTCGMGAGRYNESRGARGGFVELFFNGTVSASGAAVRTTFTPPAGIHYLQADVSRFEGGGSLSASLDIGGQTLSLGTLSFDNRMFKTLRWPTFFTADGVRSVILTITYSSTSTSTGGAWADNFALCPANDREIEFVSNGDFEQVSGSKPVSWSYSGGNGNFQLNLYGDYPAHFGTDTVSGLRYLRMGNDRCALQTLTLPTAGCYRLTYFAHSRLSPKYRDNPIRAWLSYPDGTTNVLATSWNASSNFVQHACVFSVPAAGSYTLGLEGLRTTGKFDPAYEVLIDDVSVRPVATDLPDPEQIFPKGLRVKVGENARLNLAFIGTNRVSSVVLGGISCQGIVDAQSQPDFISGMGAFEIVPTGTVLLMR